MSELDGKRWEDPDQDPTPQHDFRSDARDEISDLESQIRILDERAATMVGEALPPPPPRPYPFWGWLDALMMIVLIVVGMIASALVIGIANVILATTGEDGSGLSLAQAAFLMQAVGFGLALFGLSRILRVRYGVGLRRALELKPPTGVLLFAGLGLGTALLVAFLGAVLRLQEMDMPMNEFIKTDADLILIGIAAFTFGPLFEELIFRGFLQPLFIRGMGVAGGILATSLLFALPHGPQYGWHWQHLLIIIVAGSIFGVIRWRAGSTTASTIAHAAYNGFLVVATMIQRSMGMG